MPFFSNVETQVQCVVAFNFFIFFSNISVFSEIMVFERTHFLSTCHEKRHLTHKSCELKVQFCIGQQLKIFFFFNLSLKPYTKSQQKIIGKNFHHDLKPY